MTRSVVLADSLVAPLLMALRDCLCCQLESSLRGPTCRCVIRHALSTPSMDACDCNCGVDPATGTDGQGDAWVRLVQLQPEATSLPLGSHACPQGWTAIIELGTYRCITLPEEAGPLAAQDENDIAMDMLSDMNAMVRALGCCEALTDRDVGVDFWQPLGPSGGCAGGALQIRVAIPAGPNGRCP